MIGSKVAKRLGQSQGRQFRMVAKKSVQFRSINIRNSEAKGLVQSQGRHRDKSARGIFTNTGCTSCRIDNLALSNNSVLWLHCYKIRAVPNFDSSTRI